MNNNWIQTTRNSLFVCTVHICYVHICSITHKQYKIHKRVVAINKQQNEQDRITYRSAVWQNVVNECTQSVINEIIPSSFRGTIFNTNSIPPFEYKPSQVQINDFLSYLVSWKGLNTKLISTAKQPQTCKEYFKSKKLV